MRRIAWMTLVLVAAVSTAGAATLTLDHDGTLFRLAAGDDQLVVEVFADEGNVTIPVPQTTGIVAANLNLAVDEAHGTLVVIWEERVEEQLSRIQLATYQDGTWWGPAVIAGEEWGTAGNPEALLHVVRTTLTAEDGSTSELATTTLHLAWWARLHDEDGGYAVYQPIELTADGVPMLETAEPHLLSNLSPWGVACTVSDEARTLAHPKFFVDPETGDPHLMVASLADCLFGIYRLASEVVEDDLETHRRRHVVILGRVRDIAIAPGLQLQNASLAVGHGMSVVAHWDDDESVQYVTMNESGWSQVRSLGLGPHLDHERAVELIRSLTR